MDKSLTENAPILIAVLGLILTIIVQWEVITKRFSNLAGTFDSVPFIIFKLLVVSFSGTFVASIFYIILDLIVAGKLSLNVVLTDIASGAAWGIPIALLSSFLVRGVDGAVISGVIIGIIILLLVGPKEIITPPQGNLALKQIYSIALLLFVSNMGMACGYIGFRTRSFIDKISAKPSGS